MNRRELDLQFSTTDAISFERRIVAIQTFLPDSTFNLLRSTADRQPEAERIHIPVHKRGATISHHDLHSCAPEIVLPRARISSLVFVGYRRTCTADSAERSQFLFAAYIQ